MSPGGMSLLGLAIRQGHELVIEATQRLTADQLGWRAGGVSPSVGRHLWHLALWADHLQATLPALTAELESQLGPGDELWGAEDLAIDWDLAPATLGTLLSGTGFGDGRSAGLTLPPKAVVLDYAARAFALADRAIAAVVDDAFFERGLYLDPAGELTEIAAGDLVTRYLTHLERHLGMIDRLRGLQGAPGLLQRRCPEGEDLADSGCAPSPPTARFRSS